MTRQPRNWNAIQKRLSPKQLNLMSGLVNDIDSEEDLKGWFSYTAEEGATVTALRRKGLIEKVGPRDFQLSQLGIDFVRFLIEEKKKEV